MTIIPQALQQHWTAISPLLSVRNEDEYDRAVECLNHLLDEVGTDEQHPLYTLVDTLGLSCMPMKSNTTPYQSVAASMCSSS